MIYRVKKTIPSTSEIVTYELAPCLKCDGDDMNVDEYEDQFGCITTVTCKKCKREVRVNLATGGAINEWNNQNDINILIATKLIKIGNLKNQIKELKDKLKQKTKKNVTRKSNSLRGKI